MDCFSLAVHLGCSAEERRQTQEVRVSVQLRFQSTPAGCTSDSLEDTVCYAQLAEAILSHCRGREFQLIERLGFELYKVVRQVTGAGPQISVRVHKVRPPVDNLLGGSVYCCGDFAL